MSATTIRVRQIDGDILIDSTAMGLLLGVAPERITGQIPEQWFQQGRRRAREAAAATGSYSMLDNMRYWAQKDHGAELEVAYQ
jgi:hypothetical protein